MKLTHVVYDPDTFGITQRSLRMLRNTLAEKLKHRICIVQIGTDELCCGFLIFDQEFENVTYTGDGFRTDGGGEGGAGARTAEALMYIFGTPPITWIPWEGNRLEEVCNLLYENKRVEADSLLLEMFQGIVDQLNKSDFKVPRDVNPQYIRG